MIIVDTHVVIWLAFDQAQLSRKARSAIDDTREKAEGLAISDITLLELATLTRKGRLRLDISLESFLQEVEARFVVLPITGRACARGSHDLVRSAPSSAPGTQQKICGPSLSPGASRRARRSLGTPPILLHGSAILGESKSSLRRHDCLLTPRQRGPLPFGMG